MFQMEALQTDFKRLKNFLEFAKNYFIRKNPIKAIGNDIVAAIKESLTVKKKLKMAQYRLNYHKHQLNKMESLIAENNSHSFLKGKNLNETR